jgi:signal transduction histidine kinase
METTIYRVAQEALTNILRHAVSQSAHRKPSKVSILLQRLRGEILTVIEDDGPGFEVEDSSNETLRMPRLGIFGMHERARLAGGTLRIESEPGRGTAVTLKLPVPPAD